MTGIPFSNSEINRYHSQNINLNNDQSVTVKKKNYFYFKYII